MKQELIINGQHVDMRADTDITLEWVSGLFEDIGSIKLSHSYSIKLPKTLKNLRIFDDPGNPAHQSTQTRRYLDALYIRNGIDLLGPVKAYIVGVSRDDIEIVLLWRAEGLLSWRDQKLKLSATAGMWTIKPWVNLSTGEAYYSSGSLNMFLPKYDSGLGDVKYPAVNAASYACVKLEWLFIMILGSTGLELRFFNDSRERLRNLVLLCNSMKSNKAIDIPTGSTASGNGQVLSDMQSVYFSGWSHGWDKTLGPIYNDGKNAFLTINQTDGTRYEEMYLQINVAGYMDEAGATAAPVLQVIGHTLVDGRVGTRLLQELTFVQDYSYVDRGYCTADLLLTDLKDVTEISLQFKTPVALDIYGVLSKYDTSKEYTIRVSHKHPTISIANDNAYPVADNLPDISQVDFIKGVCALLGLVLVVNKGILEVRTYDDMLDKTAAVDWTDKISGPIQNLSLSRSGLARTNYIRYAEDKTISTNYNAYMTVDDETIQQETDLVKLPFAASESNEAHHFNVKDDKLEEVDIKPRIFAWEKDENGIANLMFPEYLKSQHLIETFYQTYQDTIQRPVEIEALVRLSELDLAGLDFSRAVYLGQTGQYYAVKKVQTSDSDLCKVELIQLA